MRGMFPAIEPRDTGMLAVGDGHEMYWERCGNPEGCRRSSCTAGRGRGAVRISGACSIRISTTPCSSISAARGGAGRWRASPMRT